MICKALDPLAAIYTAKAFWIILLAGSLFGAGTRFGKSRWAGLLAVVVGGLNSSVLGLARDVNIEFPTMAVFAFGIYAFSLTENFTKKTASIFLGIVCGLSLLTKLTAAFYLAPFLAAAFLLPVKPGVHLTKHRFFNLGLCLLAALLVAAAFYLPLFARMTMEIKMEALDRSEQYANNFRFYIHHLLKGYMPPLILLLAAFSSALLVVRRDRLMLLLAASGIAAFGFLILMQDPAPSYLYCYQVLVAIVIARSWRYLKAYFRIPALIIISLIYLWPLALNVSLVDEKDKRIFVQDPSLLLRLVYPIFPRMDRLVLTPDTFINLSWDTIWSTHRVLSQRFGQYQPDQIAVAYIGHGSGNIDVAMAMAYSDGAWNKTLAPIQVVDLEEEKLLAPLKRVQILQRPLLILSLPHSFSQGELLKTGEIGDFLSEMNSTHHLEFAFQTEKEENFGGQYHFYTRDKNN